jgi:hypothetical protein
MTQAERSTVEALQAEATEAGLTVSLNDVIRHMIRRSQMSPPRSEPEARAAIVAHWGECPHCDATTKPLCLDGLYLQRSYYRVAVMSQGHNAA